MKTTHHLAHSEVEFRRTVFAKWNHFTEFAALAIGACTLLSALAAATYEPYTFTTLAGGGGFNSPDVPGTGARFWIPAAGVADNSGNLYISDVFNNVLRKVTPQGEVTTLAGLPGTFGSADGTGSDARFYFLGRPALDSAGNIYVGDGNNTIRKVTPEGIVTALAGLAGQPGSENGTNSDARFNSPDGVEVDNAGNVYVAEFENSTIRKLTPVGTNWVVTTIAGRAGSTGSADGTNSAARFNHPQGLAIDGAGNLYVDDSFNYTIRKVTPVGTNWVVTTIAGKAGSPGNVDGTNGAARFNGSAGLALDADRNIYVADTDGDAIRKVTQVGTNWVVTTLAGRAGSPGYVDGIGSEARFNSPYGVVLDGTGNLYVMDTFNDAIRKMTMVGTNWVVTTLAGVGGNHGSADGRGRNARFMGPTGIAVDSAGNAYVADQINHTVRKVTPEGAVTTLAGLGGYGGRQNGTGSDARFNHPDGVAVDGEGNVYVGEYFNNTIRKITPTGAVTTLATDVGTSYGVAIDRATNLYAADFEGSTIRKVTRFGSVTTFAGNYGLSDKTDGIGSAARFNHPTGVAVDSATNVYVTDTWNHTIRKITAARVVTTIAGQAGSPGNADGIGGVARFDFPTGAAVDASGNLYVADAYNNTIRKLTPLGTNWVVTTLGGMSGFYGTADGAGSAARFSNPSGIAVDSEGNIYVADFYFNTIRKGYPPPRPLNARFAEGLFKFKFAGAPGQSVIVEASTDLSSWLPIWTNSIAPDLLFSDEQSGVLSRRFYRARMP